MTNVFHSFRHCFDGDACCVICGFDGAEWQHLRQQGDKQPPCIRETTRDDISDAMGDYHGEVELIT